MELYLVTLECVATMLLLAIPGFVSVKMKLLRPENISTLSLLLMYVVAPAMTVDAYINGSFSTGDIWKCLLFFVFGLMLQFSVMGISYRLFCKKKANVKMKILTMATILGNCGFIGIPLLKAVLPQYPLAVPLSTFFALGMNMLVYTVGFYIISGDKKYVSAKKFLVNPVTISTGVGFGLFILSATTSFSVPELILDAVSVIGAMSTPLCMLIIGMRLATVSRKQLLGEPTVYLAILIKQIIVPLIVFWILYFIPLDENFKNTLFVMTSLPVASMILMTSEVLGDGQKEAASTVLLSTLSCVITIPTMMLLIA